MKIYLASSWRNQAQPMMVNALREEGHEVYDFRNPGPERHGFGWPEVDPKWKEWTPREFEDALHHPIAIAGFDSDFRAMQWADACVLLLPCGRSAHLELGWATGKGKITAILLDDAPEPELMYRLVDYVATTKEELFEFLRKGPVRIGLLRTARYYLGQ